MVTLTEKLKPTDADVEAVLAALVASEVRAGRDAGYQPFSVLLSDEPDCRATRSTTGCSSSTLRCPRNSRAMASGTN
jgi:hypothetical protein